MSSTAATSPVTFSNFTGVDFNQILTAVTAAAQVPISNVENQLVAENTSISTLGTIGGDFTSLQTALSALDTGLSIAPMAATASANAPFSTQVLGAPVAGTYSVTVNQLASAQSVASQGYASDSASVGDGTLTIASGGTPYSVTVNSTNDTLAGLAGAINAAGAGVSAQVVDTGLPGAPYRLLITSDATGSAQQFSVSSNLAGGISPDFADNEVGPTTTSGVTGTSTPTVGGTYTGDVSQGYQFTVASGGTVGTDALTINYASDSGEQGTFTVPTGYTAGQPITVADGLTLSLGSGTINTGDSFGAATFVPQISAAQDAKVTIGNQVITSSTNGVTNAIPGVMLALSSTGGPATVNVAPDQIAQGKQIDDFVTAYNTLVSDITTNTQAVPNQTAPPLANDGGLRSILFNLQMQLGTINLSDLGISVDQHTGQLSFSQATFATAQDSAPTAVSTAQQQLYSAINPVVTGALQPNDGVIAAETASDQQQVTSLTAQITTMNNQLNQQKEELQTQYALLQGTIASYQSLAALFTDSSSSNSSTSSSTPTPGTNLTMSA